MSPIAFLIRKFVFFSFLPLLICKADVFHIEWSFRFESLHERVLWSGCSEPWAGDECLYIVKWWTTVYLLFVYSRFIYNKKWVYSINLYRLNHYDCISYADVENVDEHHVLSLVTDADLFSGFLPVVFFNWWLVFPCFHSIVVGHVISVQMSPPFHTLLLCVGMDAPTCWVVRLSPSLWKKNVTEIQGFWTFPTYCCGEFWHYRLFPDFKSSYLTSVCFISTMFSTDFPTYL